MLQHAQHLRTVNKYAAAKCVIPRALTRTHLARKPCVLPGSRRNQSIKRRRVAQVFAGTAVADLAQKYDIQGLVTVKEGRGGLTTVQLRHACGASAEVALFGGCVLSWVQASGDEVLYIRPDAVFDQSKPISGGIPFCFPQFGPGQLQQHGFARNLPWSIASTSADLQPDERDPSVELVLEDSEYTQAMWPHPFKAIYTVTLHGEELQTSFRVVNTGASPFTFTAALHTYIEVKDIEAAAVKGLQGLSYLDKRVDASNPIRVDEERELVIFRGLTDSVYLGSPGYVELDVGTGAAVAIRSSGWQDVVVWNPGESMSCYKSFCCVENAVFGQPATVGPGASWEATQAFNVIDI